MNSGTNGDFSLSGSDVTDQEFNYLGSEDRDTPDEADNNKECDVKEEAPKEK